jgi:hypothetical protein
MHNLIIREDGGDKLTFGTFEAIAGNRRTGLHFSKVMYFVSATIKLNNLPSFATP